MESGQVLRRLVRRKSGAHAWRWRVLLVAIAIFGILAICFGRWVESEHSARRHVSLLQRHCRIVSR